MRKTFLILNALCLSIFIVMFALFIGGSLEPSKPATGISLALIILLFIQNIINLSGDEEE